MSARRATASGTPATVAVAAAVGAAALVASAVVLAPAADAAPSGPEDLPEPTAEQLAASVRVWDPSGSVHVWDPSGSVHVWDPRGSVRPLETVENDGGETTISLATDILFTPDSADVPPNAAERIAALISDIPDGASVTVGGHTDSVRGAVDNQQLSTDRATAVADVLRRVRPDLVLEVAGFADTRPAVQEDADDPSTRAANRRVEIVYAG
ncbi:OmpA family protein [Georgenia soli]|uniref:OmpA family protein n=1 Tax=Georgenia soli TaxID=638953 RepID=A0A2A9ENT0_9MICO|nr:OmpA family protein [Georgenia soli]PFG40747.1 OmpA family protein [Georgenia soli]